LLLKRKNNKKPIKSNKNKLKSKERKNNKNTRKREKIKIKDNKFLKNYLNNSIIRKYL
jgi:hypothetical protein